MTCPVRLLVTFALKGEARMFQIAVATRSNSTISLVTGIGRKNAVRTLRFTLSTERPASVLTCGFAGALDPDLACGTVIFSADDHFPLTAALLAAGARPAKIHCADRVAATVEEKRTLRQSTGADAVEMESGVIRALCLEQGIPSATVRVISDAANDDLPFDFNQLMDAEQHLSYGKLALALLASPRKIGTLLKLRQQTHAAAKRLAEVLGKVISSPAPVPR